METGTSCFETLKSILKNIRSPHLLDDHPWTRSLIVQESLADNPQPAPMSPGVRLVHAIAHLFLEMQPATPPRRGKRLDPRWGEYGLLAALYFTPFRQGTAFPASLLEAWRRIDSAILYQVYGKPAALLNQEEIERYRLVGDEADYGSTSTLSDWHKKGLQRLADLLVHRERFLSNTSSKPATIAAVAERPATVHPPAARRTWPLWLAVTLLLGGLLLLGGYRGWQIYIRGEIVVDDVSKLQEQVPESLDVENLDRAYPHLVKLKNDLGALRREAGPFLALGPGLGWVPVFGGDLAASQDLLLVAEHLLNAADLAYQASGPLLSEMGAGEGSDLDPAGLTALLTASQPGYSQARLELDQALAARSQIDPDRLSPRLRALLVGNIDPVLERADEGLSLVTVLPVVLGASAEGPKTYLLLAQNEDELRSTGGFITSVGKLVVHNGQVISLEFEQVDNQEDWTRPYPPAPWQMREYMNARVLLLRDANWSPDFPTTAQWAEYLYAYTHANSVDGVIAFDQQFLVMLLRQLGPLDVEGAPEPITAENVIPYMRASKKLPAGEPMPVGWHRKEFMSRITSAILTGLMTGGDHDWRGMADTMSQALEERHLLLQFDHPEMTALLAKRGWENAVRPGTGDFLMVTDTNMGFNKTNAVVEERLSYVVDLADLSQPQAVLTVSHSSHANPDVPCVHWNTGQIAEETSYPIDRCYWSYLRVYKQAGVSLLEATPHAVPGAWMLLGRDVPAQVDPLEEDLPGVQGVGTLIVLPGGESLETRFHFSLPPGSLSTDPSSGQTTYSLKVQKQPGTLAVPLDVQVVLPGGAEVLSSPPQVSLEGSILRLSTSLRTDVELLVTFRLPQKPD